MNKNKKDPPKVIIGATLKVKKSLQFRRVAMDLATDANVDMVMHCMTDHDEIRISRETTAHEVNTAFKEVQDFTTKLLATESLIANYEN